MNMIFYIILKIKLVTRCAIYIAVLIELLEAIKTMEEWYLNVRLQQK